MSLLPARAVLVVAAAGAILSAACAEVAPYDRGRLAHPTMARSETEQLGRAHIEAIHEGAVGGEQSPSSGCGCN